MAYTDNFTNSNGTNLEVHSASWVTLYTEGDWKIFDNQARQETGDGVFAGYLYNQTFASKHYAQAVWIAVEHAGPGPAIRMATGPNYYYSFHFDGDKVYNGQVVADTPTDWDSGLSLPSGGDIVRLEVDDTTETTIYYKVNGAVIETYTSKSALSGGKGGLAGYRVSAYGLLDDWEAGDVEITTLTISVSENITVSDTPVVSTDGVGDLAINKSEYIIVFESVFYGIMDLGIAITPEDDTYSVAKPIVVG